MIRIATALLVALTLLGVSALTVSAQPGEPVTRTFAAPVDRTWAVTESVLKSLDWGIDTQDRATGLLVTDSRGVQFKDFGVYGEGTRHKLHLTIKAAGESRTSVAVARELYREERILWMKERKPLKAEDQSVELAVLDAIGRVLPPAASGSAPGGSAAPAAPAAPSPGQAARADTTTKVIFWVTGTAGSVSLAYRGAKGETERQAEARLPWETAFDAKVGESLYVSAVAAPGEGSTGSVTCEILVAGATRAQSTSVGASAIATCSAAAERR